MLNRDTLNLIGASRDARFYSIRCERIAKGEFRESDIKSLREFGEDIINFFLEDRDKIKGYIMGTFIGFQLAASTEFQWLSSDEGPYQECGKGLRELGFTTLSELGEVLRIADYQELQKYAPALISYFRGYSGWASNLLAEEQDSENPCYEFPPSQLEKRMLEKV